MGKLWPFMLSESWVFCASNLVWRATCAGGTRGCYSSRVTTLLSRAIKSCLTSSLFYFEMPARRGELRTPLLSRRAAKRAFTGVSPIETRFDGVRKPWKSVGNCFTGLGDLMARSFYSSQESFSLSVNPLMSSAELKTYLIVLELACQ